MSFHEQGGAAPRPLDPRALRRSESPSGRSPLPVDRGDRVGVGGNGSMPPYVNRTLTSFDTPGSSMVTP